MDELDKLRRTFREHVKDFYGDCAVVRRSKNDIRARAIDGTWRATVSVYDNSLLITLWPLDETLTIRHDNPNELSLLDAALERCAAPLKRWTASAVKELVRTTLADTAYIYSAGANTDIIHPKDSTYGRVTVEFDESGVEVCHGEQNIRDRVREIVLLDGDFEEVRTRLFEAIQPRIRK